MAAPAPGAECRASAEVFDLALTGAEMERQRQTADGGSN